MDALYGEYPNLRETYGYDEAERAQFMPEVRSVDGLCELIGVTVHQIVRSSVPYVGFEISCSWDPEHSAGVLMNGTRVVEVGGADTAILLWIAEADVDG